MEGRMTQLKPESEELKEAKEITQEGIDRASEILPKDEEVKVGFGWSEESFVLENMSGVSGKAFGSDYFYLFFNTSVENWKTSMLASSVHEYGHTWFYERIENDYAQALWKYILDEALTQNLAEKLVPEFESPWRKEHSREEISEYWPQIKQNLVREVNHPDPLYIDQSEDGYPNWLGYSLSYLVGQKLLEEHDLEDFSELEKEDVVRIGNQLFGEQ